MHEELSSRDRYLKKITDQERVLACILLTLFLILPFLRAVYGAGVAKPGVTLTQY